MLGIIDSMFMLANIIFCPIVGKHMSRVGRKNVILLAYVFLLTATFGYGLASYITNTWAFFFVTLTFRFI